MLKREIVRGCVNLEFDGVTYYTESERTTFDDWRDTIFGPMNFGWVRYGPNRWLPCDPRLALFAQKKRRKWWWPF